MRRYLPELDGLRTVAVLLVLCTHTGLIAGGYVGVDVFFVLSGYLITTIIARQREAGVWSLREFYGRRMRRLYPAVVLLLILMLPFLGVLVPGSRLYQALALLSAATYTSDLVAAWNIGWLGAVKHTWSLAIEEQFYLLWPLIMPSPMSRAGRRGLVLATAVMLAFLVFAGHVGASYVPTGRGGVLLLGCLLALYRPTVRRPGWIAAASVALLITAVATAPTPGSADQGIASVIAGVAALGLVAALLRPCWLATLLGSQPLMWFGQRSYGIYLFHFPIAFAFAGDSQLVRVIATVGGSIAIAAVSFRLVESRFRAPRTIIAAAPAC